MEYGREIDEGEGYMYVVRAEEAVKAVSRV
jgi:hypothetical protein